MQREHPCEGSHSVRSRASCLSLVGRTPVLWVRQERAQTPGPASPLCLGGKAIQAIAPGGV